MNETRHMTWHKTCKCICRLTASVCNNRQRFNEDTRRYECKELIDKGFIWNPSTCKCECDKLCRIGENVDYKNCISSIIDRLIEDCTIVIDKNKIYNETLNTILSDDCVSCTLYVVLSTVFLAVFLFICIGITKINTLDVKYSKTETLIY